MNYQLSEIISNERISKNVYFLKLKRELTEKIIPGQFYMIKIPDKSPLLARPLSVCELCDDYIGFCYVVVGTGTAKLAKLSSGEQVYTIGPLGNGFPIEQIQGEIAIVAGGIGIAPFVEVIKYLDYRNVTLYAGFTSEPYLLDRFNNVNEVNVSTDDGSYGYKGFITELFHPEKYDVVLTCGPEILMEKIVKVCQKANVISFASMDKHMACGIGACLVCACKTLTGNKRCCKDGPVFKGQDLVFEV